MNKLKLKYLAHHIATASLIGIGGTGYYLANEVSKLPQYSQQIIDGNFKGTWFMKKEEAENISSQDLSELEAILESGKLKEQCEKTSNILLNLSLIPLVMSIATTYKVSKSRQEYYDFYGIPGKDRRY